MSLTKSQEQNLAVISRCKFDKEELRLLSIPPCDVTKDEKEACRKVYREVEAIKAVYKNIPPIFHFLRPSALLVNEDGNFPGALISGPIGVGKSCLAVQLLLAWRLQYKKGFIFTTVEDMFEKSRKEFSHGYPTYLDENQNEVKHSPWIERCSKTPLLVLDDLNSVNGTAWSLSGLENIINHRYSWMLPTIITSNLNIDEISNQISERIANRISTLNQIELTENKNNGAA